MTISTALKKKCVELKRGGMNSRQIYDKFFSQEHEGMAYETFKVKLKYWQKQTFADEMTLNSGTYPGFIAHGATVQVNGQGQVVQAWIKEHADDGQMARLIDYIKANTKPVVVDTPSFNHAEPQMLEIPLFDQHFPFSNPDETYFAIKEVVDSRIWEEINIIVGQDMLHNDDMRGRTASGRAIEKVDMVDAWDCARRFYCNLIPLCLKFSERVKITYSKGNHDESMSWAFVQMLKAQFPQAEFDDSMAQRKCITWRECFIGITHGAYKRSTNADLRGQFTIQFPVEFATAKVREIHAGHLHHEEEKDIYGVMCRRLSRNGETDGWSDDEGYVGAAKRFMLFRWKPGRLAGIDFV